MDEEQGQDRAAKEEQPARTIRVVGPDSPTYYYTNNAVVRMSTWDFLLDFGQIIDATEEEIVVTNQFRVAMSPQHAKVLAGIFSEKVRQYEEQYGPIPSPRTKGVPGGD